MTLTVPSLTMHRVGTQFMEMGKNQMSKVVKASVSQQRNLRLLAGKFKNKQAPDIVPSITNDNPELVQSDQTGFHKVVIVEHCRDKQCHNKSCDTEHEKVCSLKNNASNGVTELAGGLTHKIPCGKNGVELDSYDVNGEIKYGPQKLVTEKTTVPVDKSKFKQDAKATEYVQQKKVAEIIKNHLPSNSPLNLKKTSECNPSQDEEI